MSGVVERLTATGRVHVLRGHEHLGGSGNGEQVRDVRTGAVEEVTVRHRVVDARYQEAAIPFEVAAGVRLVPINRLPEVAGPDVAFTVLGSGKTAADAGG